MPQTVAVAMTTALDESFFYYRHKCRFDVQVDSQEQRIVLPLGGSVGAITVPTELLTESASPVIRHPGGDLCTILTVGSLRITKSYRAGLQRTGIIVGEPGGWVVLPMSDNDPNFGWVWVPKVLEANPTLARPSAVFAALNSSPTAHDAMADERR